MMALRATARISDPLYDGSPGNCPDIRPLNPSVVVINNILIPTYNATLATIDTHCIIVINISSAFYVACCLLNDFPHFLLVINPNMRCEPRSAFIRIKSVSYILANQEMWRFPSEARLDFSRSSRSIGHVTSEDKITTVHTTNSVKVESHSFHIICF
jgi:hypothetical protein